MAENQAGVKKRSKRKKHVFRRIVVILLILLIIAGAGFYIYSSLKKQYTVNYTGYTASIGSISNSLSFSGSLALVNSQTVTADADATVKSIYAVPGEAIHENDRLVRLSSGTTFKADIDGKVNTVSVSEGDEVLAGDQLMQIADFEHMKVNIRVDEYDISSVSVGQQCRVTATATERVFESTIAAIDYISASTGNVAYYTATAYVDVEDGIYPGMQVTVTIPQEEAQNVVVLKMDALSFDFDNSAYVYMYGENGELEKRSVEVGVSNGNYVEIKSGLSDGDEVYVEAKVEETQATSLFGSLFGSQQMTPPGGGNFDRSNFDPSNMPGGGNFNPGSFSPGSGSGSGFSGGPGGGAGGGGSR